MAAVGNSRDKMKKKAAVGNSRDKMKKKFEEVMDKNREAAERLFLELDRAASKSKLSELYTDALSKPGAIDENLSKAAKDAKIDKKYGNVWNKADYASVRYGLKSAYKEAWDDESRKSVREVAKKLNIKKLYKLAAKAKYEELARELDVDVGVVRGKPYKELLEIIAENVNLDEAYSELWG